MADCVGDRVVVTAHDGKYEGIIQLFDIKGGKITLSDVTDISSGIKLHHTVHLWRKDLLNLEILEKNKKKKQVVSRQDDRKGRRLVHRKEQPAHLRRMQDVQMDELILSKRMSGASSGEENEQTGTQLHRLKGFIEQSPDGSLKLTGPSSSDNNSSEARPTYSYTVIEELNNDFHAAVGHIKLQTIIGLGMEPLTGGRHANLCWLQVSTKDQVLLFDMLQFGKEYMENGLAELIQSGKIQKVVHDCRLMSDLLFHQYKIGMVNVFDTQVADAMIYRNGNNGDLPRYVNSLSVTLFTYTDLTAEEIFIARKRASQMQKDESVWAVRPVPMAVLEAAVKNVLYLRQLRLVLLEKLLTNFVDAVDISLGVIRDSTNQENEKVEMHVLPREFRNLHKNALDSRERFHRLYAANPEQFDERGFRENCSGVLDPQVRFSHTGLWHRGDGQVHTVSSFKPRRGRARDRLRSKSETRTRSTSKEKSDTSLMEIGAAARKRLGRDRTSDVTIPDTGSSDVTVPASSNSDVTKRNRHRKDVTGADSTVSQSTTPSDKRERNNPTYLRSAGQVADTVFMAAGMEQVCQVPKITLCSDTEVTYSQKPIRQIDDDFDVVPTSRKPQRAQTKTFKELSEESAASDQKTSPVDSPAASASPVQKSSPVDSPAASASPVQKSPRTCPPASPTAVTPIASPPTSASTSGKYLPNIIGGLGRGAALKQIVKHNDVKQVAQGGHIGVENPTSTSPEQPQDSVQNSSGHVNNVIQTSPIAGMGRGKILNFYAKKI